MTALGPYKTSVYLFGGNDITVWESFQPARNLIEMVFAGMAQDYSPLADLYSLDTTAATWTWQAITPTGPSPSARWGHTVTRVADDMFFLFGGYNGSTIPTDCAWTFNATSRQWTRVTIVGTPPRSRAWHTANCVDYFDKVLIYGGISNMGSFPYKDRVWLSDAYLFDVVNQTFQQVALQLNGSLTPGIYDPVSSGSMSHACARIGTNLYITYGMDQFMMQLNAIVRVSLGTQACPPGEKYVPSLDKCFTTNGLTGAATCDPKELVYTHFIPTLGLREAILAVAILFITMSIGIAVFVFVYRKQKVMVTASRRLLYIILFGSILSYLSIAAMYSETAGGCLAAAWLTNMGFAFMIGGLIFKTWRIASIFNSQGKNRAMKDKDLLKRFAAFIILYAIYHVVWSIVDRPKLDLFNYSIEDANVIQADRCTAGPLSTGMLIICLICLIVGVWVTIQTRNVPSAFNESRYIGLALYNWLFIGVILQIILRVTNASPDAAFVIQALSIILTAGGAVLLLFIPKIILVLTGQGDQLEQTFHSSNSGSHSQSIRHFAGTQHDGNKDGAKKGLRSPTSTFPLPQASAMVDGPDGEYARQMKILSETMEKQKMELAALRRQLDGGV
ncbi:hypothetical protein HK104_008594 [Borealophlyctis nickersoniae]|nr:hypothetical protein HK104_008594 [Borealophlyctis nickersoniae]